MKIGLLAMSGVRAKDEELLRLGLTLPGFVDRSKVIASLPSLGLLYIAAVTPPEHEVRYFEALADGQEPQEIYSCDLVAISSLSAQIYDAYAIAAKLRDHGVITALGGLHASSVPHEAFNHVDHVIVGEGENIWPKVVAAIEAKEEGRIWFAREAAPVCIESLPPPRYDLLLGREYNRFTVQTSRGCPWRCDFCASSVMLREKYRKRPIANIVRDIQRIIELFPRPFIEFADDNTFVDKRWGKELCRALIPLNIKWFTETDISVADDPELLELMREAGCRQVLIGLESPAQEALVGLEQRTNFKARAFEHYRDSIHRIQSAGITVNGCFILGLEEHTPAIFQQVLDFVNDVGLYEVQITVLTPFPGTPLYRRLSLENRLIDALDWQSCTLFDVNFVPKRMSPTQLRQGLYWLSERLYAKDSVNFRRRKFFQHLRQPTTDVGLEIQGLKQAA